MSFHEKKRSSSCQSTGIKDVISTGGDDVETSKGMTQEAGGGEAQEVDFIRAGSVGGGHGQAELKQEISTIRG